MKSVGKRLARDRVAVISGAVVLAVILCAVAAPLIAPGDPNSMGAGPQMSPAGKGIPMGTDWFGRDIFARVVYGARVSLWIGFASVAASAAAGTILGLVAGYSGGKVDSLIMRSMDILFAFPEILLALAIVATLGPGTSKTILAIAVVNVPVFTRTVRGSVLSVKGLEYVESSIAVGAGSWRVMTQEIFPNVVSPLLVQATMAVSGAIRTESALSFLGLGIQPPDPSWGGMISEARPYMELAPWMILWPVAVMTVTILAFNIFGDALRDLLDPRARRDVS